MKQQNSTRQRRTERHNKTAPITAAVLALFALPVVGQETTAPAFDWQTVTLEAIDGSPLRGERTTIPVPEHHDRPAQRFIELSVVRFATSHPRPAPPVFFLAGGPGGPGAEGAAVVASHPQLRLLEHADVIGVDQRGAGQSRPNLVENPLEGSIPLDEAVTRAKYIAALRQVARRTAQLWSERGVDLSAYNTRNSARDLDAVRAALGLEQIVLYASSYGSHLGLEYIRQYPDRVRRAVFLNVEGPDHTWKLPTAGHEVLTSLDRMLTGDPASRDRPALSQRIAALLRELESAPVDLQLATGGRVRISAFDLRTEIAFRLGSVQGMQGLPGLLDALEAGDFEPLRETSIANHQPSYPAMSLAMDCSSAATPERLLRLSRETRDPRFVLGDTLLMPLFPEVCEALPFGPLDASYRQPIRSNVPVLFVSGTLDARTPPSNAMAIIEGFENGIHVIAKNASHDSRQLMAREFRALLQAFLRGEDVRSTTLSLPEPIFR